MRIFYMKYKSMIWLIISILIGIIATLILFCSSSNFFSKSFIHSQRRYSSSLPKFSISFGWFFPLNLANFSLTWSTVAFWTLIFIPVALASKTGRTSLKWRMKNNWSENCYIRLMHLRWSKYTFESGNCI